MVEPRTASHKVVVAGEIVELVFTKLDPMGWRDLVALFPPRAKVTRDRNLGYNYDLVPSEYPAGNIRMIIDDQESQVSQEEWRDFYGVLESPDLFTISTVLWGMHEWEAQQSTKKALRASKKK